MIAPKPLFRRRIDRRTEPKLMTVCIAAICEQGRKIVVATDTRLSYGGIATDSLAGKIVWRDGYLFMFAGTPSRTELILEEVRSLPQLERTTLYESLNSAYRKTVAKLCAHTVLSQYDLTMDEFKAGGLTMFGVERFKHLSDQIDTEASYFNEQLLVVGHGEADNSAVIYEIGKDIAAHGIDGIAAIGSGSEVALSNLLLLGQARYKSLSDTIYSVAAAKFASEMSHDVSVGRNTTMFVAWRRSETDPTEKPPGVFLQNREIQGLREVWEEHGRPRVPASSAVPLSPIIRKVRAAKHESPEVDDLVVEVTAAEERSNDTASSRQSASDNSEDQQ